MADSKKGVDKKDMGNCLSEECYSETVPLSDVENNESLCDTEIEEVGQYEDDTQEGQKSSLFEYSSKRISKGALFGLFNRRPILKAAREHIINNEVIHIKRKKVAFWAPVPGSGAKETAVNTAGLLVKYGEGDVCIIDMDYLNPSLDHLLDIDREVRNSDSYLDKETIYSSLHTLLLDKSSGRHEARDVFSYLVQHKKYKKLFAATGIYQSGVLDSNSHEVLTEFIDRCYSQFDYVIIICSPLQLDNQGLINTFKACDTVYTVMEANAYQLERVACHLNNINGSYYMEDSKLKVIVNKYDAAANLNTKEIYRRYGCTVTARIGYSHLHTQCRNTRELFIDRCSTEQAAEYIPILQDIGYKPNKVGRKKLFRG